MKWIASAGIDVVVVSWYPKEKADQQGQPWDALIPLLLKAAEKAKIKMTFHLEPYAGRSVDSIREDIQYLTKQYGKHAAFYRTITKTSGVDKAPRELPLFYIYDSYLIEPEEW